ncbi:MAG: hypothetical protein QM621_11140 [Aeromicrobium sp.]|uniref:hypothetical protein n=1 Tax=Aeromicrobium sp. TaxID=1871063 RepID=UPI0039E27835
MPLQIGGGFLIVMIDEHDPAGTTVHAFADRSLWEWLHHPEDFDGGEAVTVTIPDTSLSAHVTVWDPLTDKAQHLVWLPGGGGSCHQGLTPLDLGPSDTDQFRRVCQRLREAVGEAHVVEGLW